MQPTNRKIGSYVAQTSIRILEQIMKISLLSLAATFNFLAMEQSPEKINLPVQLAQSHVFFDAQLHPLRMLTCAENMQNVPDFQSIYDTHSMHIIENTSPILAKLITLFPHDPRLLIVIRYAQAVAMRLSLFSENQRAINLEWARMCVPKNLKELYYIFNGKSTNRVAANAQAIDGQKTLKEKFTQLLQQFRPEKIN